VVTHSDAMQKIASAQPAGYNHPPCPIRNDLPDTDALMSKSSRKPDVVAHYHPQHRSIRSTALAVARVSSPLLSGLVIYLGVVAWQVPSSAIPVRRAECRYSV